MRSSIFLAPAPYRNVSHQDDTANLAERNGRWHHLAVTWSSRDAGKTQIYKDGLLMATAYSQRTSPLEPGGALMLGGEQVGKGWVSNTHLLAAHPAADVGRRAGGAFLTKAYTSAKLATISLVHLTPTTLLLIPCLFLDSSDVKP